MRTRERRTVIAVAAILCCAALLSVGAATASAGVRMVTAEKLRPYRTDHPVSLYPLWFVSKGSTSFAWAPVRLPVGAKVKQLWTYTWGTTSPETTVFLMRTKVGGTLDFWATGADVLMLTHDIVVNSYINPPTLTKATTPAVPGRSDLVIRKGYRYFIWVWSANPGSFFQAARIFYK